MPLDTSEPLPIPPFAAVENFGQAIGFLRRPPKKGLCEWVNNCGQAVASTYAGGSSEILKLAMGKPADDLVLEDFNCAWEYWKMAFRQVWDIYKLEEETDRGDGSHFEAFVEAWVFYMAYETKLLVKRARGEHVTPSDSEVENKEELFNRRLLELVAPLDDENFLDSINRMTPERAGEAVTGINALISMVTNHSLDSLELTDFTCNCQARNMLFHDVWLQFHLKHVADRSTGIFPAFKKAWLQYIQQEKALFGMRRDGEVLDEGEEATAEDFGSQAMAVIEEAPTVLDASSIQTINGFSPKFATRAVRSRKRKLRFYEKVLSGEEQMERRHIVGLVGTVSRFKEFWDELDPADEGAVHELVRDLKTRIEVEVGALEKRGTGGLVEGEKVEGPEDLVVKFNEVEAKGLRQIDLFEAGVEDIKKSPLGETENQELENICERIERARSLFIEQIKTFKRFKLDPPTRRTPQELNDHLSTLDQIAEDLSNDIFGLAQDLKPIIERAQSFQPTTNLPQKIAEAEQTIRSEFSGLIQSAKDGRRGVTPELRDRHSVVASAFGSLIALEVKAKTMLRDYLQCLTGVDDEIDDDASLVLLKKLITDLEGEVDRIRLQIKSDADTIGGVLNNLGHR